MTAVALSIPGGIVAFTGGAVSIQYGTPTPASDLSSFLGENPDASRIYDNVQVALPGVTLAQIKLALWNTIEDFCLRSTYMRRRVNWTMAPGVGNISFNPFNAELMVCWVLQVKGLHSWRVHPPATLIDQNNPIQQRNGTAVLVLKPTQFQSDGDNMPAELFVNWFETLLNGTLARLYIQPAKPWSSTQLAQFHGREYNRGCALARDVANREYADQASAWAFPYWSRGRRKQ
jgi:hypothetical protein